MSTAAGARHTVAALLAGWRAELAASSEYRVDVVIGMFVTSIWLGISVAPMLVVASHTDGAGGWTLPQLLFLQAVWYGLDGVVWAFLIVNVGWWDQHVRMGTLDPLLLRPVNALVTCSLARIWVPDLPKFVLAGGLAVAAAVMGGGPTSLLHALATVAAVGSAMVLMWGLAVVANVKVLTHVQFDGWAAVFAAQNLARVPTTLYGDVLRFVFTALVPIGFFATVPAQLFFGQAALWLAGVAVVLAAVVVRGTWWVWQRELQHYSGAMS